MAGALLAVMADPGFHFIIVKTFIRSGDIGNMIAVGEGQLFCQSAFAGASTAEY
tara:strand:- start:2133 stop:2294 length:162 start_codon:yes stop_codon:yes gene_type:complete